MSLITKAIIGLIPATVEDLLRLGNPDIFASISKPDKSGNLPMRWAAAHGDVAAVQALLRAGADPNRATDRETATPITCTRSGASSHRASAFRRAAVFDEPLEAGADVELRDVDGMGPLQVGLMYGYAEFVRRLLEVGADLNAYKEAGASGCRASPAVTATYFGRPECLRIVHEAGSDLDPPADRNETPLMVGMYARSHECVAYMPAQGADHLRTDDDGRALLHYAAKDAGAEMFRILVRESLRLWGLEPSKPSAKVDALHDLFYAREDRDEELDRAWEDLERALAAVNGTVWEEVDVRGSNVDLAGAELYENSSFAKQKGSPRHNLESDDEIFSDALENPVSV